MVRLSVSEYIRNVGYNIVSVLMLTVTFVMCAIFLSNISAQSRFYNFISPFLNENSIIIGELLPDFDVTSLTKYEKSIMTREIACTSDNVRKLNWCLVYDRYSMDKLKPRLKEGKQPDSVSSTDGIMNILISDNKSNVGVGDVINLKFWCVEGAEEGRQISIPARVTGIIASGQKVLMGTGTNISKSMESSDIFGTYNYEQLEFPIIITTEKELEKLPEAVLELNYRCIVKFDDSITAEERVANYNKIINFENENKMRTGTDVFPKSEKLVEMQKTEMRNIMTKYIPLTIAVFIIISICIICMISIKNANSMRYYATLYICGMPYKSAVFFSGAEMTVNSVLSALLASSFIVFQNKFSILGKINCELNALIISVMLVAYVIIIFWTVLVTRKILRERSAMDILRDTAY